MKVLNLAILGLSLVGSFAQASTQFKLQRMSPAYVNAYTLSYENPLNEGQQLKLAEKASRSVSLENQVKGQACGSATVVSVAVNGSTKCSTNAEVSGVSCETPYLVTCQKN